MILPFLCGAGPFSSFVLTLEDSTSFTASLFWWRASPASLWFSMDLQIYKLLDILRNAVLSEDISIFFPLDYWSVIKTEPCISAMLQNLYVFSNLCVYLFQENCGSDFFWKLFFMDFLSILLKSLWKNGSRSLRGGPCPFSGLRSGGCWRIFSIKLLNTHLWGRLQPQTSWLSSREFGSVSSPFRVNFLMVSIF